MRRLFTLPGPASICLAPSFHDREMKGKEKVLERLHLIPGRQQLLKNVVFFQKKKTSKVIEREENGNFHLATMMIHNLTPLYIFSQASKTHCQGSVVSRGARREGG